MDTRNKRREITQTRRRGAAIFLLAQSEFRSGSERGRESEWDRELVWLLYYYQMDVYDVNRKANWVSSSSQAGRGQSWRRKLDFILIKWVTGEAANQREFSLLLIVGASLATASGVYLTWLCLAFRWPPSAMTSLLVEFYHAMKQRAGWLIGWDLRGIRRLYSQIGNSRRRRFMHWTRAG